MSDGLKGWQRAIETLAAPPAQPAAHVDYPCRTDGRCQYAIDSGVEGMGHCPKGKCVMAQPAQAQPARQLALPEIAKALADAGLKPEDYREGGMIEPLVRAIEAAVHSSGRCGVSLDEMVVLKPSQFKAVMKEAYRLGQVYWQQADSDYPSEWKKSDGTRDKFEKLIADTIKQGKPSE